MQRRRVRASRRLEELRPPGTLKMFFYQSSLRSDWTLTLEIRVERAETVRGADLRVEFRSNFSKETDRSAFLIDVFSFRRKKSQCVPKFSLIRFDLCEISNICDFLFHSCHCGSWNEQKETSVFSLCAPRLVPGPILTVTWLALEDKHFFNAEFHAFSSCCFCKFLPLWPRNRSKQRAENAYIFQLKNIFVFQTQPRNHEYGSWN